MIFNENYMLWLTTIATDGHAHDCIYKKLFTAYDHAIQMEFRNSS